MYQLVSNGYSNSFNQDIVINAETGRHHFEIDVRFINEMKEENKRLKEEIEYIKTQREEIKKFELRNVISYFYKKR